MNNKALAAIAFTLIVAAPIGLGYILNFQDVDHGTWSDTNSFTSINSYVNNDTILETTPYTGIYNNYWGFWDITPSDSGKLGQDQLDFVSTSSTYSSVPILGDGTPVTHMGGGDIAQICGSPDYKVAFDNHKGHSYTIHYLDGTSEVVAYSPISGDGDPTAVNLIKRGSFAIIEEIDYNNVDYITLSILSSNQITITPIVNTNTYADVSAGWYVDDDVRFRWMNLQDNVYEIFMIVDMPINTDVYFYYPSLTDYYSHFVRDASGEITITIFDNGNTESYTLGNYQYMLLKSRGVVSGLSKWPEIGLSEQYVINTIDTNKSLKIGGYIKTSSDQIRFRVDATTIANINMSVATNATIDVSQIKPGMGSYVYKLEDPVVVGSSITFAGETFNVVNNSLIVGSHAIDLSPNQMYKRNILNFYSRSSDGVTWDNYINNYKINSTPTQATITLNGTWGATHAITGQQFTHQIINEWVPGHVGIDMTGAAIIGLGVCVAAFVILGMAGVRSGGKVLWLAAICGGAAIIFITLI